MDFNHFLTSYMPDTSIGSMQHFKNMLEECVTAEKLGYATVSIPEHHLINLLMMPSPLQMAVKIASITKNIKDLSSELELDRTTVLRNIKKLIEMDLVSYKYENGDKNKIIQLTTIGKSKLREAIIIWEETQHKYIKALGIKNYKEYWKYSL